jgi:hypothetical protein
MDIDYRAYAKLHSVAPTTQTFAFGEPVLGGALSRVIGLAMERLDQGHSGVMVLVNQDTLLPEQIREIAARNDFPG